MFQYITPRKGQMGSYPALSRGDETEALHHEGTEVNLLMFLLLLQLFDDSYYR